MQVDTGRPPPFLLALPHFLHGSLVYLCHGTSSAVLGLVGLHLLLTTMQITRCVQKPPVFEDSLWGSLTTTYGRASDFCISQLGFLSPTPPSLSSQYLKIGKTWCVLMVLNLSFGIHLCQDHYNFLASWLHQQHLFCYSTTTTHHF